MSVQKGGQVQPEHSKLIVVPADDGAEKKTHYVFWHYGMFSLISILIIITVRKYLTWSM